MFYVQTFESGSNKFIKSKQLKFDKINGYKVTIEDLAVIDGEVYLFGSYYNKKAKKNTFLRTFRMAKATDTNNGEGMLVEVLAQFWHNHEFITRNPTLAHPLITYADLIATADIRNIETAKIIRDNQIEKLINKVTHEN